MKLKHCSSFAVIAVLFFSALLFQMLGSGRDYHAAPAFKVSQDEPAARSYAKAVTVLSTGGPTNLAIALLKHALTQAPNNPDYHAALASAYTDRAAVIYRAFFYHRFTVIDRREQWTEQLEWIADRVFSGHIGETMRTLPHYHDLRLKDDGASFHMSDSEAVRAMLSLEDLASAQWNKAYQEAICKAQAADIDYQHACSDWIFYRIGHDINETDMVGVNSLSVVKPLTHRPFGPQAFNEIHSAALAEPNIAMYWVLTAHFIYGSDTADSDKIGISLRPFLLKALDIEPNNNALRMCLCYLETKNSPFQIPDLLSAARHDPKNSAPLLLASLAVLDKTRYAPTSRGSKPDSSPAGVAATEKSLTAKDVTDGNKALMLFQQAVKLNNIHLYPYHWPFAPLLMEGRLWIAANPMYQIEFTGNKTQDGEAALYGFALTKAIEKHPEQGAKILTEFASLIEPMTVMTNFDRSLPPYQLYSWNYAHKNAIDDRSVLLTEYGDKTSVSKSSADAMAEDTRFKDFEARFDDWEAQRTKGPGGHTPY
jgi:hypothetical protein